MTFSSRRLTLAAATAVALIASMLVASPADAFHTAAAGELPGEGSISGRVYLGDPSRVAPFGSVIIWRTWCAEAAGCADGVDVSSSTNAAGDYSFTGLANGFYTLTFNYFGGTAYRNAPDQQFEVSASTSTFTGADAIMPTAPSFTGHVYLGSLARSAVAGEVTVAASLLSDNGSNRTTSRTTNAAGDYTIPGLRPGTYHLTFIYSGAENFVAPWSGTVDVAAAPIPTYEISSESISRDTVIPVSSRLSGVVDAVTSFIIEGAPDTDRYLISFATVTASRYDSATESFVDVATTQTNSHGEYVLPRLLPGQYRLRFSSTQEPEFFTQYWGNAPENPLDSTTFTLTTGIAKIANMTMRRAAHIAAIPDCVPCREAGFDRSTLHAELQRLTPSTGNWVDLGQIDNELSAPVEPGTYRLAVSYVDDPALLGLLATTTSPFTVSENEVVTVRPWLSTKGSQADTFADVPSANAFYREINYLFDAGISTGTIDAQSELRLYSPSSSVSRQAMAAFLYRAAGSPAFTPPTVPTFDDVPSTSSVYFYIEWMAAAQISTGTYPGDGTRLYKPLDPVSRQAMSLFLYRFAESPSFSAPASASFTDVPAGSVFYEAIEWMKAQEITTGYGALFKPGSAVTRQAMAAFLYRLLN